MYKKLIFVDEQVGQAWAKEMKDLLVEIKEAVEQANERDAGALAKR